MVRSTPLSAENGFDITHHGCAVVPANALSLGAAPPWAFSRPLPRGSRLPCAKIPHSRQLRALRHPRDEWFELRSLQREGARIRTLGVCASYQRIAPVPGAERDSGALRCRMPAFFSSELKIAFRSQDLKENPSAAKTLTLLARQNIFRLRKR